MDKMIQKLCCELEQRYMGDAKGKPVVDLGRWVLYCECDCLLTFFSLLIF